MAVEYPFVRQSRDALLQPLQRTYVQLYGLRDRHILGVDVDAEPAPVTDGPKRVEERFGLVRVHHTDVVVLVVVAVGVGYSNECGPAGLP